MIRSENDSKTHAQVDFKKKGYLVKSRYPLASSQLDHVTTNKAVHRV